ncbi:hypothetical protein T484DRAFT_1945121 [Baffinella frigidus]|nr:hypothetical protein T484DRAFT_1945121 [Cryptophyta sp. CCMP2293]
MPIHGPAVVLGGGAAPCERGTPVTILAIACATGRGEAGYMLQFRYTQITARTTLATGREKAGVGAPSSSISAYLGAPVW